MAKAGHKGHMGGNTVVGHPHVGSADPTILDEDDLSDGLRIRNSHPKEGDSRIRNQRTVLPGSQDERNQPDDG